MFRLASVTLLATVSTAGAATWEPFIIRQVSSPVTPLVITGTADGSAVSTLIDESGEKTGYGIEDFNGLSLSTLTSVSYTRLDAGAPDPYLNIWITDGTNSAVIAPVVGMNNTGNYTGGNDINGLSLQSLGFNIYETDFSNLSWLGVTGATRVAQGVVAGGSGGTVVTLADIGHLTMTVPGTFSGFVGTGAPKNDTAVNLVFGDTQGNFVTPLPYSLANVSAIPEPASLALLALGAFAALGRRNRPA